MVFRKPLFPKRKMKGKGIKYFKVLNFCKEYYELLNQSPETIIQPVKQFSKIELYYNQKFFLYFYDEEDSNKEPCISRAVIRIGNNSEDVFIQNISKSVNTDYSGSVNIHSDGQHLIFHLHTAKTKEKSLFMNFIISPEKIPPLAVGAYCNINKRGALVAGSLVITHIDKNKLNEEDISSEVFRQGTPEYNTLNKHLIKFLQDKEQNYLKVTTGIFDYED